jgi:putative ABC transport system permease protein
VTASWLRGSKRRIQPATLLAALLLAAGAAAVIALFGPVYSVLLARLPFPHPRELVSAGGIPVFNVYTAAFPQRRELTPIFSGIAAYWHAGTLGLSAGGQVDAAEVTSEFFSTIGVRPQLGKIPSRRQAGQPSALISYGLWRSRFAGAWPPLAGLRLNGRLYRVAGVMPKGFEFPFGTEAWEIAPTGGPGPGSSGKGLLVLGRLAPGVSLSTASERLAAITARTHGFGLIHARGARLQPLRELLAGGKRRLLWAVWAVAALFFLLACAGAASLAITRSIRHRREYAIRLALGASPARLRVQALGAILADAALGSAAGLALAWSLGPWVRQRLLSGLGTVAAAPPPGTPALAILAATLALLAAAICGLAAAWSATTVDPAPLLKPGAAGPVQRRWQLSLIERVAAAELVVATALVLLGLSAVQAASNATSPLGFSAKALVVAQARVALPAALVAANNALPASPAGWTPALAARMQALGQRERLRQGRIFGRARRALAALPGVAEVAELEPIPFGRHRPQPVSVYLRKPGLGGEAYFRAGLVHVSGNAFAALGVPLLSGRDFSAADRDYVERALSASLRVGRWPRGYFMPVIVSRRLARRLWPDRSPLGLSFFAPMRCRVIGEVASYREGVSAGPPQFFEQAFPSYNLSFLLRLRVKAPAAATAAAAAVALANAGSTVAGPAAESFSQRISGATAGLRLALDTLLGFAALSLAVAGAGVYLSSAEAAAAREREYAVRLALGASRRRIYMLALRRSIALVGAAAPAGIAAAWILSSGIVGTLRGFGAISWRGAPLTVLLLAALAIGAGMRSARRCAIAAPADLLRSGE